MAQQAIADAARVRRKLFSGSDEYLWQEAKETFATNYAPDKQWSKKYEEFKSFLASAGSVDDTRDLCQAMNQQTEDKYSNREVKIRGRVVIGRDCVKNTLANVEAWAQIVDKGMAGAPETVSLAWSCVRFVLTATTQDAANYALWASAAEAMSRILVTCKTLAKLYGAGDVNEMEREPSQIVTELLNIIPATYHQILVFSWSAKIQTQKSSPRRIIGNYNPFSNNYKVGQAAFDAIVDNADIMSKIGQTAFQQISHQVYQTLLDGQSETRAELDRIQDILRDNQTGVISAVREQGTRLEAAISRLEKPLSPYEMDKIRFKQYKELLNPSKHSREKYLEKLRSRQEGTCTWIFDSQQYHEWICSQGSNLLWIEGAAGFGKSVLMSTIIDKLQTSQNEAVVGFFFCIRAGDSNSSRSANAIRRDLVYRLYKSTKAFPRKLADANHIFKKYEASYLNKDASGKDESDIEITDTVLDALFIDLACMLEHPIYLAVDALDECTDVLDSQLLRSFNMWMENSPVKIVISSRPNSDEEVSDFRKPYPQIDLRVVNMTDIKIKAQSELAKIVSLSSTERRKVLKRIAENAQGQFTYVNLAVGFFRRPWRRPIETVLVKLSDNVNSIYQEALNNVDENYLDLAKMAIKWTLLRQGPLTVEELNDIYSRRFTFADGLEGSEARNEASEEELSTDGENDDDNLEHNMDLEGTKGQKSESVDGEYDQISLDGEAQDENTLKIGHESAVKMFREQINIAAKTFLSVDGQAGLLHANHQSVRDCFIYSADKHGPRKNNNHSSGQYNPDGICPTCERESKSTRQFLLYPEDHLGIAIALLRHLRSSAFRSEVYRHEISTISEQVKIGESAEESQLKGEKDLENEEAVADEHKHQDDPHPSQKGPSSSEQKGPQNEDGVLGNGKGHENDHESSQEHSNAETLQGYDFPDSEDEYLKAGDFLNPKFIKFKGAVDSQRYEVVCWPLHIRAAEEAMGSTPDTNDSAWNLLWQELKAFFADEVAFRSWKLQYGKSFSRPHEDRHINDTNGQTPLHIAVWFGLTWVAKQIITENPESCLSHANIGPKKDYLPVHIMLEYDGKRMPDINEKFELLQILLKHTTLNSRKTKELAMLKMSAMFTTNPNLRVATELITWAEKMAPGAPMRSRLGQNPLHAVAWYGTYPEVVELLVQHGVDINLEDKFRGETPLFYYFKGRKGRYDVLRALLNNGVDIGLETTMSQMALLGACEQNDAIVASMLVEKGADFEDQDLAGLRAVHHAARRGSLEVLKVLVAAGAEINACTTEDDTPFSLACGAENPTTALYLLEELLRREFTLEEIDQKSKFNKTPLRRACWRGHNAIIQRLLDIPGMQEKRMNFVDRRRGRGLIHAAACRGNVETVKLLVGRGADPSAKDLRGKTPLKVCCEVWPNGAEFDHFEETISFLIDKAPEVARADANLMHFVAAKGSLRIGKQLLALQISHSYEDEHGWTPLIVAKHYNRQSFASLLQDQTISGQIPSCLLMPDLEVMPASEILILKRGRVYFEHALLANHPIPYGINEYYFEVTIRRNNEEAVVPANLNSLFVCVGLTSYISRRIGWVPGWSQVGTDSAAYHSDDGCFHHSGKHGQMLDFGQPPGQPGSVIGCGYLPENGLMYFTVDGQMVGYGDMPLHGRLFPVVGKVFSWDVEANFGLSPFVYPPAEEKRSSGRFIVPLAE